MNGLLTTRQAASRLQVDAETVRRMLREGTLRGRKIGNYTKKKHWRIKECDLESLVNTQAGAGLEHTEASNDVVRNGAESGACS